MAEKKTAGKKAPDKPKAAGNQGIERKQSEKKIENKVKEKVKCKVPRCVHCNGTGGCFYFLGFLGALIYYVTTAPSLWDAFLGFFKALLWPAFLVHGLLLFMGA